MLKPLALLTAIATATTLSLVTPKASAYFATLDTGELIKQGHYQAMFSPQMVFNQFDGANFSTRLDTGFTDDISGRVILGFGKVDFQTGAMVKWVPYPDTSSQPAIGGEAGFLIARVGNISQYSLRFHPLVSKTFETEVGDVVPYGSLPFGFTVQSGGSDENFVPIQLVGGAEMRPLELKNWSFFGELGVNLNKSFGYISFAAAFRFDDDAFGKR